MTLAIHALPKPVIAAINGPAVGIGATMTLGMDLRLASTKARIGFVFGRLGIVPEAASSWFLPRIVGIQQALEWVYSADILTAEQALAGRLLRSVHEPDDLLPTAYALANLEQCRALPRRAGPGQAGIAVPQRRRGRSARGPPVRLAGDVPHLDRRRQGGGRGVPREAGAEVHRGRVGAAPDLPGLTGTGRAQRWSLIRRALPSERSRACGASTSTRAVRPMLPDRSASASASPGVVRRVRGLDAHGDSSRFPGRVSTHR